MSAADQSQGASAPPANKTLRNLRIGAVAFVATGLLIAHRLGVFHVFTDPARIRTALLDMGPWGYLVFVVAYALLQPFGVPGTVFIIAAPLIWSWPVAFVLSMIGTMAASVVGFSFARFVARDFLSRLVPARFHAYDAALAKRAFGTVVLLRFIFWMPPMLHVFFGVSRVRFWTHFWGSLVGYLVPLFLTAYFGERLFELMKTAPLWVWGVMVAVVALGWTTYFLVRRYRKKKASAPVPRDGEDA